MPNNHDKIDIMMESGTAADGSQKVFCTIKINDPALVGKSAVFDIIEEVIVHDSRPVNGSKTIFTKKFVILESITVIDIDSGSLQVYSYQGSHIDINVITRLKVDDKLIFDTSVSEKQQISIGMKPQIGGNPSEMINPKDSFDLRKNLKAIPPINQLKVKILMAVGAVLITLNTYVGFHDQFMVNEKHYFYSRVNSDGESQSPMVGSTVVDGIAGGALWLLILSELRKYMTFKFKQMPTRIRRGETMRVSDLIGGMARVELNNIDVRIVVANLECGQYKRGSGTKERTVSFSEPVRAVFVYNKHIDQIPANVPVEQYFNDTISFDNMFSALYPPTMAGSNHGMKVHWEVQLIHREFVDQELVGNSQIFEYKDFLSA